MTEKFIAIIQTGSAIESARHKYGDFNEWFIKGLNIDRDRVKTYKVFEKTHFPDTQNLIGIIITGSSFMLTDEHMWSKMTIEWLKQFVDSKIPILGVCYGHQLLANMLGGKVDWNPKGREIGQITMHLTTDAYKDKLLSGSINLQTKNIKLLASHQQSVIELPASATLLGNTKLDPNHCFCYEDHIWGLQFHPEFTSEITRYYIQERTLDITNEELNPTQISNSIENIDNGSPILKRFRDICEEYSLRLSGLP